MNILEALELSKETGRQYSRLGGGGWIRYKEGFVYELSLDDLLSNEWQDSAEVVKIITNGKWQLAEGEKQ